ncbi:MAG: hypothetical protein KJP18_06420 [Gemmatimonadetes bacterium]|nr:hypothetical protein [Gemmatimonadota bacterium]
MSLIRPVRLAAALIAAAVLTACASNPQYPGNRETYQAQVEIDNGNSSLSNFTVHLVSANGPRQRLGNVNLNETRSFSVSYPSSGGRYQLMATLISGYELFSPAFTLTEGDMIVWNLQRNRVFFAGNARQ